MFHQDNLGKQISNGGFKLIAERVFYEYEGRWRHVSRSLLVSSVVSVLTATAGILALQALEIDYRYFVEATPLSVTQGGALFGLVVGIALGLQIGLTLRLYRLWEVSSKAIPD